MRMRYLLVVASALLAACGGRAAGIPDTDSPAALDARTSHEHVIYDFQGGADGAGPEGTLIADASGALYGTTTYGGISGCTFGAGCGTVFKLAPNGNAYVHTVLYKFLGASDGDGPGSGVIADSSGALYGTTEYGGSDGDGIVFRLTPSGSSYKETVLYTFTGGQDGNAPLAGLTIDSAGDLFGATLLGGGGGTQCHVSGGCGTLFELQRSGSSYTERVIYRFRGGRDGATPSSPPVFVGNDLYGTAATGGGSRSCGGAPINTGCGTIYKLTPNGNSYRLRVIYRFMGQPDDAANPFAGLTIDARGNFYGVGQYGGAQNQGAVFVLKRSGKARTEKLLHSFGASGDASYPLAGLTLGANGLLYGASEYGGSPGDGTVFDVETSGAERVLLAFTGGASGANPGGGILAFHGALYGTATYGGTSSSAAGIVFKL
jgi:uncharacterized repeat protein (TIGR03803 family)